MSRSRTDSDSGAESCSGRSSTNDSVPIGLFEQAMNTIGEGNAMTHSLMGRMMDRMDQLEIQLSQVHRTAMSALEPNVPIDASYVNYRLLDNQEKIDKLLPMMDDEMLYAFEQCLVDSAAAACDKGIGSPDKVRFYFPT
jgi:hypothetical protein